MKPAAPVTRIGFEGNHKLPASDPRTGERRVALTRTARNSARAIGLMTGSPTRKARMVQCTSPFLYGSRA